MASVQPRRSARTGVVKWRVMFRIGSTQRQETFEDEASARQFKRLVDAHGPEAAMRVLLARRNAADDMPTLREFTLRYLAADSGLLTGIQTGTREGYAAEAERSFLTILGDMPVDAIDKSDIGRWLEWQAKQPTSRNPAKLVAPKTIRNYHSTLSSVLNAAIEAKLRPDNPAYRMRIAKGVRDEPVFLSVDEFTTLLHFFPERYQRLVFFLAGTGLRWSEATALAWFGVNLHSSPPTVRVERAWKKAKGAAVLGPPKSQKSRRTVSMPADVVASLGAPKGAADLVFTADKGGKLWYGRFRTSVWEPAVDKAMDPELCAKEGLTPLTRRPTAHDLRHSHASWLIAAGAPLPYIQERLGHESIQTTVNVYGHLVPDAHRQMADLVGTTLAGVRGLRQVSA